MVYQLETHITYIKCIRGNNSHMESPDSFGSKEYPNPEDVMSKLVKQICRNLLRLRRSSGHKKNSVWGDNSYNVKYLVTQLSVFKAHTLYDIIF